MIKTCGLCHFSVENTKEYPCLECRAEQRRLGDLPYFEPCKEYAELLHYAELGKKYLKENNNEED